MTDQYFSESIILDSESVCKFTLSITIPTYNRAYRLSRSLDEIRRLIFHSEATQSVSVYVTDNGSTDNTSSILEAQKQKFINDGIYFEYELVGVNKGFGCNMERCFRRGVGEYCWFVSDDDNIMEDILVKILADIKYYRPNIIIYNFDQQPYDKTSPLIRKKEFFNGEKTDFGFNYLVQMAKLTSLVIKRINNPLQSEVFSYDKVLSSGFAHIALAMQTAYHYGRILVSNDFIAKPDPDFRNHIDFPPYVGNGYNKMAEVLFHHMGKPDWASSHSCQHVDVGVSALEWLIDYYKGRAVVPYELRLELHRGFKEYVAENRFRLFFHPRFIRRCIYFAIAWIQYQIYKKMLHLQITKHRNVGTDKH